MHAKYIHSYSTLKHGEAVRQQKNLCSVPTTICKQPSFSAQLLAPVALLYKGLAVKAHTHNYVFTSGETSMSYRLTTLC